MSKADSIKAMLYLAETNSSMKDFYDICSLCRTFDFDGRVLYEAVYQTLQKRGTPLSRIPTVFSESFPTFKDKQIQWSAFKRRIVAISEMGFAETLASIKAFLMPIYECILKETEFFGHWDCERMEWKPGC